MLSKELYKNWEEAYEWHKDGIRPGAELDWYAVDSKGYVTCLITAGFALVPKIVFRDKEMLWKTYNYFYKEPKDYKVFSKTHSLWDYDTTLYSNLGLYVYDNPSDMKKPYELVKTPKKPLHISKLPREIEDWLKPITFENLEFSSTKKIHANSYFETV